MGFDGRLERFLFGDSVDAYVASLGGELALASGSAREFALPLRQPFPVSGRVRGRCKRAAPTVEPRRPSSIPL